jgi:hypothetical protein
MNMGEPDTYDKRQWWADVAFGVSVGTVLALAVLLVAVVVVSRHELRFEPDNAASSISIAPGP